MWVVTRKVFLAGLLVWAIVPGAALAGIWQDLQATGAKSASGLSAQTSYYRALAADESSLRQALATAPLEQTSSQGGVLELPLPNGETQSFEVVLSPIMSSDLAARHPDIQTYSVTGLDDPSIQGRLDMSPYGFHAMLLTFSGTVYIDPDASGNYRSYYKQNYPAASQDEASDRVCHTGGHAERVMPGAEVTPSLALRTVTSNARRVYRLAMATTGEYGSYFDSESEAESAVITSINRVNQIYGRDLAVQLQLVDIIVYRNAASDPFDQNDVSGMLGINQDVLDHWVGLDNYDIGHLFGTSGGGLAFLSSACTDSRAQGYTGHPSPDVGDPFDIDFVAHEIGHQLGATHTFNGTTLFCAGNRTAATAVEPGSGTTIMAYAGICDGENLQSNSDATFHASSIDQINSFVFGSGTGSSCGTSVSVGNSLPTSISAGSDVTIPAQTPFVLTGSASIDPDFDTLSYQWDQIDIGTETTDSNIGSDLGDNPLFRSFVPKSTPTRYFPRLSTLIAGSTDIGETLPTTSRSLNFRLTVRDGRSGVGDDDVQVTVNAGLGPFEITGGVLNGTADLLGGSSQSLAWDVAGTGTDCPTLRASLISISADGTTYCDADDDARLELATGLTNTGATSLTLPSVQIARARLMLHCENNVFFALSDNDFSVVSAANPIASNCKTMDGEPLEHGTVVIDPNVDPEGVSSGGGSGALYLLPLMLLAGGLIRRVTRWRMRG
jgi:hypothetical protein